MRLKPNRQLVNINSEVRMGDFRAKRYEGEVWAVNLQRQRGVPCKICGSVLIHLLKSAQGCYPPQKKINTCQIQCYSANSTHNRRSNPLRLRLPGALRTLLAKDQIGTRLRAFEMPRKVRSSFVLQWELHS